jgi:quinol-cytochrome oxidoreductase complex cytochrome b subunit
MRGETITMFILIFSFILLFSIALLAVRLENKTANKPIDKSEPPEPLPEFKLNEWYNEYDKIWEESMMANALTEVQRDFPNDKIRRTGKNTITVGEGTK